MKNEGHPPYQNVLFVDTATGDKFVCGTTLQPAETEVFEGKEYPVFRVPVSSKSHPFFTGSKQFVDTGGRISRFQDKYAAKAAKKPAEKKPAAEKKVVSKKAAASKKKA